MSSEMFYPSGDDVDRMIELAIQCGIDSRGTSWPLELCRVRAKLRALLARTEAGADGVVYQWRDNFGGWRDCTESQWAGHSGKDRRILYTHPQDASGEAWKCYVGEMPTSAGMRYVVTVERESEQAKNFWDRTRITPYIFGDGERYKAEYEAACLSAFLNNTPYPDILAFNPDAAMQAKEAK